MLKNKREGQLQDQYESIILDLVTYTQEIMR